MESALIVSDYLPSINNLHIVAFENDTDIEFSYHDPPRETFGITKIAIEGFANNTFVDISSVLKQHQKTLEDLEWYMSGESDTGVIYNIQYHA